MKNMIIAAFVGFGLIIGKSEALPLSSNVPVVDVSPATLVKFTPAQKTAARKACHRKYGERLAYVSFTGRTYYCNYRKSTKVLTRQASKSCRKTGLKLDKVISIRIKGKQSITRYRCKR